MAGRNPVPLLVAAGVGIASGLYIWKQPLQQYTEEQKNKNKPLVNPSDVSDKVSPATAAAVTAPRKDAPEAAAAAAGAHSYAGEGVPARRN